MDRAAARQPGEWRGTIARVRSRRRPLFAFCSAVSLVLCVATSVLWARGYAGTDRVYWRAPYTRYHFTFASSAGRLAAAVAKYPARSALAGVAFAYERSPRAKVVSLGHFPNHRQFLGAEVGWRTRGMSAATIPAWWPTAAALVLPAVYVRHRLQRRGRLARGLCPACGYDLRATPGRCPECGTEPPAR